VNRSIRFLMGVAVVSILAPAMAVVAPVGGDEVAVPALARAPAATEPDPTLSEPSAAKEPHTHDRRFAAETTSSSVETTSGEQDRSETVGTDNSDRSDDSDGHEHAAKARTDESSTTSDTNRPDPTTTPAPGVESGGVVTGAACPCTITGAAELKGQISLRGDLVVDGGTLVARPGVDLDGNGFQIMFMNGGKADFQGSKVFTWSDRGAKQNLQRDINFRNLRRIMWMANGGASILKYFTVSDSGTSAMGDYPLHWHLNGNSTRGTVVEGVVVIDGKHHAYVPHGSHGITFKDVIAKNTRDDAIWWDPPGTNDCSSRGRFCTADNSNDILLDRVLVDGVRNGPGDHRGFTLAGFMLGAGSGNTVRNSVAINVNPSNGKNCSGFHWPSDANLNEGGNVWTFTNNYGQSKCHGIFVWQNDAGKHVISGFSGGGIEHGAYGNRYHYSEVNVPYVNSHAGGWSMSDSKVGTFILLPPGKTSPNDPTVSVASTKIERLVVDNQSKEGREHPPFYEFSNISLSCGDVEWLSVEPGTTVEIDGRVCDQ
jgi:hypothetical protein